MAQTLAESAVTEVTGRGVPVRGDEIDTDRIIPARFLKTVTFDGLAEHVFEDERARGGHPFDDKRFQGASILVSNKNFGCGSSREHAPQALMRWGIEAFVAESFAGIFFGNCVSLGLPCVTVSAEDAQKLQDAIEADPEVNLTIDVSAGEVRCGDVSVAAGMPATTREQFVSGTWDALGQLLEARDGIEAKAGELPYLTGFTGAGEESPGP